MMIIAEEKSMGDEIEISKKIIINGDEKSVEALPSVRLLDVLRSGLGLTGVKEGCGEGECGACSIILNGDLIASCIVPFGYLTDGDNITTIEGMDDSNKIAVAIRKCFIEGGAIQCGMCTPGMIMAAYVLLSKNDDPTRDEIAEAISGNLCRCTGYKKIIDAIAMAASTLKAENR